MTYMLDTDTLIAMLRGLKSRGQSARQREKREQAKRLVARCRKAQRDGHMVALSAITVSELEFGACKSQDYEAESQAVQEVLVPFECLDYDAVHCAQHYGKLRHQLEESGRPIGSMDMLIAAHALAVDATLVTSNMNHFSRVEGLKTADWLRGSPRRGPK